MRWQIFSKLKSNTDYDDSEVTRNFLENLIHLYIKNRTFLLFTSKMDAQKFLLWKNKAMSLRAAIKNSCDISTSSSLEGYKNSYFVATLKSSCFYCYKLEKKTSLLFMGGCYWEISIELEVKVF